MDIGFGVEKQGRDQVCGENEGDEGGVDVPASKDILELRIELLEDGGRVSCHCCRDRDGGLFAVSRRGQFGFGDQP